MNRHTGTKRPSEREPTGAVGAPARPLTLHPHRPEKQSRGGCRAHDGASAALRAVVSPVGLPPAGGASGVLCRPIAGSFSMRRCVGGNEGSIGGAPALVYSEGSPSGSTSHSSWYWPISRLLFRMISSSRERA